MILKVVNINLSIYLAILFMLVSTKVNANLHGAELIVKPNQCIALNKGNWCYVDIEVTWTTNKQGNFCLLSSQRNTPLQCWRSTVNGTFTAEMKLKENVTFTLATKESKQPLGTALLEVAWVYKHKKRSPSAWRMF